VKDTITVTVDIELEVDTMDDALDRTATVLSVIPTDLETTIAGLNRNK
jgi:hypothetical protein